MKNEENLKIEQSTSSIENVWVVIPAFNEESSIGCVLEKFLNKNYSILVIDDCSTDKTAEVSLCYPVTLLRHTINLGQGASLQTGFDYILQKTNAEYVITFDSDGQHEVEDIPKLLDLLQSGKIDVVLGSRFLKTSTVNGMPFQKKIVLKLGTYFTKLTTGLNVTDTHNGLRGFSISALKKVHINQNRMAHASEILSQIARYKLRYCEVPVTIRYSAYSIKKGQSVLNFLNILWDLFFGSN
jgi:glycosyltransferase involved in cell wall biosynthesis